MTVSSSSLISPESSGDYQDQFMSRLLAQITAVQTGTGVFAGLNVYSWTEQQFNCFANPLAYKSADGPRVGTSTSAMALEKNNQLLTPPFFADLRIIGSYQGSPIYEFNAGSASNNSETWVNITSAGPDAHGYYAGTADTYASGVWTTGPSVAIKNVDGKALAQSHRVRGYTTTEASEANPAYLTTEGGFTGTKLGYVSQACVNNIPVAVVTTDTYVNGILISSV